MKREFERRYETVAEVGKRCAEASRRGEQVWLGRRFVLFEITPATIAKRRLQDVIAADRAAVPCGRWVFAGHWTGPLQCRRGEYNPQRYKPHYRREVRR